MNDTNEGLPPLPQLLVLSWFLGRMRPSSLGQYLGSDTWPPCQEQQPKASAELDPTVSAKHLPACTGATPGATPGSGEGRAAHTSPLWAWGAEASKLPPSGEQVLPCSGFCCTLYSLARLCWSWVRRGSYSTFQRESRRVNAGKESGV